MNNQNFKNINNANLLVDKIYNKNYKSILDLWKANFSSNKLDDFIIDNIFGKQSKRDFIIKAYLLSSYIKNLDGKYIGVMLPAISTTSMLIIAIYLSGKVPVMFNFTFGEDMFDHCFMFSKVNSIITSNKFYSKLNNNFLDKYNQDNTMLFLEDLLKNISLFDKTNAFIKSLYLPINNFKKEDEAVILFTSGTEKLAKAVSLTHENIIENIKGSINLFKIKQDDILLGFLPPFHSFGYTVNTILPLITGLRVVYSPNPNDSSELLKLIKRYGITTITSTPTFLKMILNLASENDLDSVKYIVVGAEKCSDEIFKKFNNLSKRGEILEGYGITECSPVISINPIRGGKKETVGKLISNIDCKIIDLETNKEQSIGEQGMIYVAGKSVFNGYLDESLESPFEIIDGKNYYKTGDLGYLDSDGYLYITGRLKRFIKIAGEMISLGYIEEVLREKYLDIYIDALEQDNNSKIVLFSTKAININEVNIFLRENNFQSIIKISENIVLEEIPILGTGKVDYKKLKSIISFDANQRKENINLSLDETLKLKIRELIGSENIFINNESIFGKDIYIDSIDVGELMIFIRKKYNINGEIKISKIKTFGDLVNLVKNNI